MFRIQQLLSRFKSRHVLIAIALVLLGMNLARMAAGHYAEKREYLENRLAQQEKFLLSTRNLDAMRKNVAALEERKQKVEEYLFGGGTEEEIASAMQIVIQEKLVNAGLQTESLRPITQTGAKGKGGEEKSEYGEILIKARLAGTLSAFNEFIAELYKSKQLFKIDSFSLKAHKQGETLKIFIEIKGFYKTGEVS
ncbi:MAG: hypothetical protein KKA70_00845 [Proteobacteria bacterium]|nr:hypothetical protein [Pseudomonadota bacterium]